MTQRNNSFKKEPDMFLKEDCPCQNKTCPRYKNCLECVLFHMDTETNKAIPVCLREKAQKLYGEKVQNP
jgi:hypothetical protein